MRFEAHPRKLGFILLLLVAFVLFCMPTPQDSSAYTGETIHSSSAHDIANSVKATKRVATPAKLLLIAALTTAFVACRLEPASMPYRTPLVKSFFLPVISLRIRSILLRPLKFTSLFV
ncbi:hypothetical protein [Cohnella sp. GCM10027633]|uniref:hypothetical protein n=1 Tax=unclassified Cohnella TaxID=2636738 RepID=UPI0036413634